MTFRKLVALAGACCLGVAVGGLRLRADGGGDPFGDFITPVSNPVNFEDPRPRTEVRPLYVYHRLSDDFAAVVGANGGDAHIVAAQARLAVGDRLGLIATKDGYVWLRPDRQLPGVLETDSGAANLAFGLKYALYRDPARRAMGTLGLRYEAPAGQHDVFQGRGDGVLNPFLSGLWGVGSAHLMAYTGVRIPISGSDSTFYDLSLHGDYQLGRFYPLVEFNWVQTLDGGRRLPLDQEGFDFFNFGSTEAGGRGVVTMAVGARWRAFEGVPGPFGRTLGADLGAVYEFPVTDREDLFGWRVTTDLILWLGRSEGERT